MSSRAGSILVATIVASGVSACGRWNEQQERPNPRVLMTDIGQMPVAESSLWCDAASDSSAAQNEDGTIHIQIQLPAECFVSDAGEPSEWIVIVNVGVIARAPESDIPPRVLGAGACPLGIDTRM